MEIQGFSRGPMYFPPSTQLLFRQNTRITGNGAEDFTDLNLFFFFLINMFNVIQNECFTILFDGAYFLLAVMVERDESSRLKVAN